MGTTVKRETYTTAQPDGTLVTTMTKTKTIKETATDAEFGIGFYDGAEMNVNYCFTPGAILRFLQIICGLVIVALISSVYGTGPFVGILFGQTFIFILTGVCICLTCIILVTLFLGLHNGHLSFWPWQNFCLLLSIVAGFCFLISGVIEAYYATGFWAQNCREVGSDGIVRDDCHIIIEWAVAAFFCFVMAILYFLSAFFASRNKYFE